MERPQAEESLRSVDGPKEARVRLDLDARTSEIGRARHAVDELLTRAGVTSSIVDDVVLVVSELVSNAVIHGEPGPVRVEVGVDREVVHEVVVAVTSRGPPDALPPVDAWRLPHPRAVSGRGLAIVRRLTDDVDVRESGGSTLVVCRRRLPDGVG